MCAGCIHQCRSQKNDIPVYLYSISSIIYLVPGVVVSCRDRAVGKMREITPTCCGHVGWPWLGIIMVTGQCCHIIVFMLKMVKARGF